MDFDALKSLSDLGIDMSFLDHFKGKQEDKMQQDLDKVADKITELDSLQSERLSMPPASEGVKTVDEKEVKTAEEVSEKLVNLTVLARPDDVTDSEKIQESLSVGVVEERSVATKPATESENGEGSGVNQIGEALEPQLLVGDSPTQK